MNWRQAKTILIITFLALNIFLGYRLWSEAASYPVGTTLVSLEEVNATYEYLSEHGLDVGVPVPRDVPAMSFLQVRVLRPVPNEMVEFFFGSMENVQMLPVPRSQGEMLFATNEEEMSIHANGVVTYTFYSPGFNNNDDNDLGAYTAEPAELWAEEYIEKQRERGRELSLESIRGVRPETGKYLVRLVQKHNNIPLVGSAGVEVLLDKGKVEFFWQRLVEPVGYVGEEKPIIPATEALQYLVTHIPEGNEEIIDEITLAYYNKLYDAGEWEAVPVWAIRTGTGKTYYFNAYTGELEQ